MIAQHPTPIQTLLVEECEKENGAGAGLGERGPTVSDTVQHHLADYLRESEPKFAILDLPWKYISAANLEALLNLFPDSTKLTLVDGPTYSPRRTVRRIFPSIAEPKLIGQQPNIFFGASNVLAQTRTKDWQWQPGRDWLVLTGTTNSAYYLDRLVSLARESDHNFELNWAPGPFFSPADFAAVQQANIALVDSFQVREFQLSASLAVCRFGVSAIEVMALGIPSIILPDISHEENQEVGFIRDHSLAIVLEDWGALGDEMLRLQEDQALASAISQNCLKHFGATSISNYVW